MTGQPVELLQERIVIDAPPARVWGLVGDVRRMAEFSPQVDRCAYDDASAAAVVGTRFTNHNSHGELRWITRGEIIRLVEGREIAFRIDENWLVWVFEVTELDGGGTTLTQRRACPDGASPESLHLTDRYLGGQETFTRTMRAGMRQTLERIKAAAEQA